MKLIKVGAAVLNQIPRDWAGNKERILKAIKMAAEQKVGILCLPEMAITGYGLEDDYFCADVPERALRKLYEITTGNNDVRCMVFCIGLPIRVNNSLYNAVATIADGKLLGFTCKQHLAGDGIHYENRWFKAWPKDVMEYFEAAPFGRGGGSYPAGDVHYNIGGIKIGYEICEDAWVANRPGVFLAQKGIDVILNPSASHFSFGKVETRKNFVVDGSRAFNCSYVYANLLGNEAGRALYDGTALIASGGSLLAAGRRFSFKDVLLTTAVVDIDSTRTQNVRTASYQPDLENRTKGCQTYNFILPTVNSERVEAIVPDEWERSPNIKNEECVRAVGLGLMDYMRKSHTNGFVVSLSGGADSALVTYLCATGIALGCNELGIEGFGKKYCPNMPIQSSIEGYVDQLIATAYQATAQSGEVTRNAANQLAMALGVQSHYEWNVEPVMQEYLNIAKSLKGKELNFDDDALVLKNLQARVRSPSIWTIANMFNKLLLTTSNMSEAAVGYATMDGDTSGCVAPIAGLNKEYIKKVLLPWVEKKGPYGLGPLEAMKFVNEQQPIAELMPKKYGETDEKDLMPYWLLHAIESLVVKNRYVPVEVYKELKGKIFYDNDQLIMDIAKFFRLFSRNQWKRERYALSFHLDDHNLDPRTWCRTPILTGGYEEEIEEMMGCLSDEGKKKMGIPFGLDEEDEFVPRLAVPRTPRNAYENILVATNTPNRRATAPPIVNMGDFAFEVAQESAAEAPARRLP